jgi:hypothetical protein
MQNIQINSQKPGFLEGKIGWGRGNTWANATGHTSKSCFLKKF